MSPNMRNVKHKERQHAYTHSSISVSERFSETMSLSAIAITCGLALLFHVFWQLKWLPPQTFVADSDQISDMQIWMTDSKLFEQNSMHIAVLGQLTCTCEAVECQGACWPDNLGQAVVVFKGQGGLEPDEAHYKELSDAHPRTAIMSGCCAGGCGTCPTRTHSITSYADVTFHKVHGGSSSQGWKACAGPPAWVLPFRSSVCEAL